jgi:hypothetical protein
LKHKQIEFAANEREKQDQVGPMQYYENVDADPKSKKPGLEKMTDTMKHVKNFLHRVNPDKKSFKLSLNNNGQQKWFVIREKQHARKPPLSVKTVNNAVYHSLSQIIPEDQTPVKNEKEVKELVTGLISSESKTLLAETLKSTIDQFCQDNMTKYVSYSLDQCNDKRAKKRPRSETSNQNTEQPVDEDEVDESQLDESALKKRKIERAIDDYRGATEATKQKMNSVKSMVVELNEEENIDQYFEDSSDDDEEQ